MGSLGQDSVRAGTLWGFFALLVLTSDWILLIKYVYNLGWDHIWGLTFFWGGDILGEYIFLETLWIWMNE